MDAYLSSSQNSGNFFDPAPVLIVADSDLAKARASRTIGAAGRRVADVVGFADAPERIRRQVAASALWIELDDYSGAPTDALLDCVAADVGDGRCSAVVATSAELLDRIGAHALNTSLNVIIDADEAERAAALAIATFEIGPGARVSDVTADKNAARLRQLSEEVSRIAATLARLSTGPSAAPRPAESAPTADVPPVRPRPSGPSFEPGVCGRGIFPRICSPIRRGTCCSTCSKPRSRSCAFRYRACASRLRCRRRPRSGGSRP